MVRIICFILCAAAFMHGGVLLGARYGMTMQNGKYNGEANDERSFGTGLVGGYEFDEYRIVAAFDDFSVEKKAQFITLGAHVINRSDKRINAFLGVEGGRLALQLEHQPNKENINVGGLAIGAILLDDRYKNMQMEIAYKYLRAFGDSGDLKISNIHNISIAFLFNF